MNSKIRIVYTPKQVTSEQLEIQDRAMVTANLCAKILREEFDVEKVILFGSMIYPQDIKYDIDLPLELCSDIDLAIFGGKPEREFFNGYIRALVACGEVSTYAAKKYNIPEFKVDLVLANTMDKDMLEQINDGIEIEGLVELNLDVNLEKIKQFNQKY